MIVEGAVNAALYDLKTGNVLHVNPRGLTVVRGFEHGSDIEKFPKDQDFINDLVGFGVLSDGSINEEFNIDLDMFLTMDLRFVWYELTDRCTHKCIQCYCDEGDDGTKDRMLLGDWKRVHEQAIKLGVKKISLIGGEPLMFPQFKELLMYFQSYPGIGVEIYTNGVLLTDDIINMAREQKINFATSFYSHSPGTHDMITRNKGSWLKTKRAIEMILAAGLKLRVGVILMKQNIEDYEETRKYLKSVGVKRIEPDYVRPTGAGKNVALDWGVRKRKSKPNFSSSGKLFLKMKRWNSCLAGKIAITSSGGVLPCIFSRNHIVGNVLEQSIEDIVRGDKLQNIWGLTRDGINKCKDCEFRYACKDCRPLAESYTGCLTGCSPNCNYDPYAGKFESEVADEVARA